MSPQRILGRSVFWWMERLGVLRASRETRVGRYLINAVPFPGKDLGLSPLQRRGVRVVGRLLDVDGKDVGFAGGETAEVDAVVWTTGYKDDSRWVAVPEIKDTNGAFVHRRGVSTVPGLYFIGRSWQWTRGSALLHGVGDDASYLIGRIAEHSRPTAEDEAMNPSAKAAGLSFQPSNSRKRGGLSFERRRSDVRPHDDGPATRS